MAGPRCHVEPFHRAQQKHLLLPSRESLERLLQRLHGFRDLQPAHRRGSSLAASAIGSGSSSSESPERATRTLTACAQSAAAACRGCGSPGCGKRAASTPPPAGPVGACQLQHRILDGIQRIILVPQRRLRDLECAHSTPARNWLSALLRDCWKNRQFHVAVMAAGML